MGSADAVSGREASDPQEERSPLEKPYLRGNWRLVVLSAVIVAVIIVVYFPVHSYPFLFGMDDGAYVYDNVHVVGPLNFSTLKWAFTHTYVLNYDPITFLGHSLNVRLFGMNAAGHHDMNVILHIINALLLFSILRQASGFTGRSFMVAALFAVHPINVENVAWISELKTMLSALFFFLALGSYLWYVRMPRMGRMRVVSFCYALGLLAKPQIITFPFVLLLWDYWPLRRMFADSRDSPLEAANSEASPWRTFKALVLEKVPLFVISFVGVLLTLQAEKKPFLDRYTLAIRLGNAILSYARYLGEAFWPSHLAFDYPHPGYSLSWLQVGASLALLLAITGFVATHRKYRYLMVGWLWFLGVMLPTINIIQIDWAALADRYAYLSFVGIYLMVCYGLADLWERRSLSPRLLPALSVAVLAILIILARRQVGYWSDNKTAWSHSAQTTSHNWIAEQNLAWILLQEGNTGEGLSYLHRAGDDRPGDFDIISSIAAVEHQHDHLSEAILYYQKSLALTNDVNQQSQIFANMGHAYSDLGDKARALQCYRKSQQLKASTGTLH